MKIYIVTADETEIEIQNQELEFLWRAMDELNQQGLDSTEACIKFDNKVVELYGAGAHFVGSIS